MAGRSPAGPLMTEHRVIERMIAVLRTELDTMQRESRTDPALIDTAVDFIRTYADRCHHGKEEDILFARLAEKDLDPEVAREMQELIEDHVHARGLTRQLVDANVRYAAGDEASVGEIEEFVVAETAYRETHYKRQILTNLEVANPPRIAIINAPPKRRRGTFGDPSMRIRFLQ